MAPERKTGRIVHYIPAFVDRDGPSVEATYTTIEELLAIDFVARMKEDFAEHPGNFHRFSVGWQPGTPPTLMVEYSEGKHFYVIGLLYDNLEIAKELPVWKHPNSAST